MGDYILHRDEYIQHHGVKGMKWGVRRKQKYLDKERQSLIDDAKTIKVKADPGKHRSVIGNYNIKRAGLIYPSMHIVDEFGNVKLSYIKGSYGERYIAAGKEYINNNIKLSDYFRETPKSSEIEYDVYK